MKSNFRQLFILTATGLALTACNSYQQYQQNIIKAHAEYEGDRAECEKQHKEGQLKTELDLARCKGDHLTHRMIGAGYAFPQIIHERVAAEYEIAQMLDSKKISQEEAIVLREKADAYSINREAELMNGMYRQSQANSQAALNLLGAMNAANTPRTPQVYNTSCQKQGSFVNCQTTGN